MAQVDTVDWPNKRIYLHVDTVTQGLDPVAMHFEIEALVANNVDGAQNFGPATDAQGNEPEGGGVFGEVKVRLYPGWRYVPFAQNHLLVLRAKMFNPDEGLSNRALSDRADPSLDGLEVDIDVGFSPVEVREVNTGSGLDASDRADLTLIKAAVAGAASTIPQPDGSQIVTIFGSDGVTPIASLVISPDGNTRSLAP